MLDIGGHKSLHARKQHHAPGGRLLASTAHPPICAAIPSPVAHVIVDEDIMVAVEPGGQEFESAKPLIGKRNDLLLTINTPLLSALHASAPVPHHAAFNKVQIALDASSESASTGCDSSLLLELRYGRDQGSPGAHRVSELIVYSNAMAKSVEAIAPAHGKEASAVGLRGHENKEYGSAKYLNDSLASRVLLIPTSEVASASAHINPAPMDQVVAHFTASPSPKSLAPGLGVDGTAVELGGLEETLWHNQKVETLSKEGRTFTIDVHTDHADPPSLALALRPVATHPPPSMVLVSILKDVKTSALVSAVVRTKYATHLACVQRQKPEPCLAWAREGIGTACRIC
ncbi:hypothetical protein B0H13DRAFT_1896211 [Mycena leptocephala]|nr:hypothetical protein B0H13DRAFT_1896211 [Mycena leptocephala]